MEPTAPGTAADFKMADSLTSRAYFDNIYIPAGLLVLGVTIVKSEWLIYAIPLTLALAAWKFNSMRTFGPSRSCSELPR